MRSWAKTFASSDHSEPNRWNPNGATATNHAVQGPPFSDAPEETWVMVTSPQPRRQDVTQVVRLDLNVPSLVI
jgi:hypothetical protein